MLYSLDLFPLAGIAVPNLCTSAISIWYQDYFLMQSQLHVHVLSFYNIQISANTFQEGREEEDRSYEFESLSDTNKGIHAEFSA